MSFLNVLAEKIQRHWKRPAGSGRVAFGVQGRMGVTQWMVLDCGRGGKVRWSHEMPEFDAALGLDEDAAAEVLNGRLPKPDQLCIKTGDEALLESILSHYFGNSSGTSLLELRAGACR